MTICIDRERLHRMRAANQLLKVIAGCGRHFFRHKERVAYFEMRRQRVWLIDHYTSRAIYTHHPGPWQHFTGGGTLRCLARHLVQFIFRGDRLPPTALGPNHKFFRDWGYGADFAIVCKAARKLGITEET